MPVGLEVASLFFRDGEPDWGVEAEAGPGHWKQGADPGWCQGSWASPGERPGFAFPRQEKSGGEVLLEQRPAMRPAWDRLSGEKEDLRSRSRSRSGWWRSALISGLCQNRHPDPAH